MSTSTQTRNQTHILVVPFPAQGHMIPLIDFIQHLSTLTPTTTITILTTPKNLHLLTPLLTTTNNITPLILPFPATAAASSPEHVQGLPPYAVRKFIPTLSLLLPSLRLWFESQPFPPTLIISDFFAGWMHRFAVDMGIKRVVFSPSGAFALSLMYSLWKNMPKKTNDDENSVVLFHDVPNCPKYPWRQLSYMFRSYVEGDADSEFIKNCFTDDMASWGLVVNSFNGLERVYLDHLMDVLGHDRVWAVGPLLSPRGIDSRGGSSSVDFNIISSWLNTCRDVEVVYVSFGTQALLSTRQTEVVAEALEASGIRFIWSVRDPLPTTGEGDESVLNGFVDRVAGRGMVITGWSPQIAILKHKAVGTFFTHCGWNSILESLMAGVGMLAWPMGADQYANATLIVDQLKVGVRVCEGPETVPDPNALAQIIVESVNGVILDRQLIEKFHTDCLDAVSENGSSSKALAQLVNKLTE